MGAPSQTLDSVVIRFAGDSGDGMQLTGTQFTNASAIAGNDVATLPDFPAEIRAPAGTLAGVSGFQLHFASFDIHTPGDAPDALVAMNPAALMVNVEDLKHGGLLLINTAAFTKKNLDKAGYTEDPRTNDSLQAFQLVEVDVTKLTQLTLKDAGLPTATVNRCKNMFALGMMCWLYDRPLEPTINWLNARFAKKPELVDANVKVLKAGYNYGVTTEEFTSRYEVRGAELTPGTYRSVTGNTATCYGLLAASVRSGHPLFLGSYPITPASDILHELARHKNLGVVTFQAEDEIAAVCASIGAAFAGRLALTSTSGPGMALKTEAIGLAIKIEVPLVIINVQRGGPSTGLPTKTEQADLFQAVNGRNGEAPLPVVAASTPSDCFETAIEACRIALTHMTPVVMLTDGYLANGAEPWSIPDIASIPEIKSRVVKPGDDIDPLKRDDETLARPWALPGTPGYEHRIGGLESDIDTGNVSYNAQNHEAMILLRQERVDRVARDLPPLEIDGDASGELLVLGWGSTAGAIRTAINRAREDYGLCVSHVHLRHLNPFPSDLGEILGNFEKILVPEMNTGQLAHLVQGRYPVRVRGLHKVQGKPFTGSEILAAIQENIGSNA